MRRLCVLALLVAGCGAPTELMLIVKATAGLGIGPKQDIDTLRISVQPADEEPTVFYFTRSVELCPLADRGLPTCRPQQFADPDYDGALTLPIRFLLQPGADSVGKEVRVWIDGLSAGYTMPRLQSGLRFKFARGHRLWLEVPLYKDCLDYLACQEQDLLCGKNRDCTMAQPTTSPPGADDLEDLSVPREPADLAMLPPPPDFAKACGAAGEICCAAAQCDAGFHCETSVMRCVTDGATCGEVGLPCCANTSCTGTGLSCTGGTCTTTCGDTAQACCAGMSCARTGDQCFPDDVCRPCGTLDGEACCPSTHGMSVCSGRLTCVSTTCHACGAQGQPACATGTPCDASLVVDASGMCMPCGGQVGATCCPGPTCGSPSTRVCDTLVSSTPSNQCVACGTLMAVCCKEPSGVPCSPGLACNGTSCIACGGSGQACCPGSDGGAIGSCNDGSGCVIQASDGLSAMMTPSGQTAGICP